MKNSSPFLGQDDPLCGKCSRLSGGCCITSLNDTAYCFPLSEPEIERLMPHAHLVAPLPATPETTGTANMRANGVKPDGTIINGARPDDARPDGARPDGARPDGEKSDDKSTGPAAMGGTDSHGSPNEPTPLAVCSPEPNSQEFIKSMSYLFPTQVKKIHELFPASSHHYRLRLDKKGACIFLGEAGCRLPRGARPWYCLLFPAWFQSGELTVFISDVCLATRDTTDPLQALQRLDVSEHSARKIYNRLIADWGFTDE